MATIERTDYAEQEFDLRSLLAIVRRRIPHFVVPFIMLLVVGATIVYLLPPIYRASAKILVESQQIPDELARSTVTSAAAERIAVIRQRLMTRSNLLEIVREFGLFDENQSKMSPTDVVAAMRNATAIQQIEVGQRGNRTEQIVAFEVSFEYEDANTAARIANKFVELILEQNIQSRTRRASKTAEFFERQVANLEKELALKEAAIVKFKSENEAALPDSLAYRRALLTDLQSRLPEIEQKIQTLTEQKALLSRGETVIITDPIEKELTELNLALERARASYSERHPTVKKIQNRIAALEKAAQSANEENSTRADEDAGETTPGEEVRRADIEFKITSLERQIDALTKQKATEQDRITELKQTLAQTPQVEIMLNALSREYKALEFRLSQARSKMAEAATGEQLEEDRQSERFEVIERAAAPSTPTKPERPKLYFAALLVSIAAGAGVSFLFEMLDSSIRSAGDLQRRLQIRPIVTVPFVVSKADRRRKWQVILSALAGVVVIVFAAVVMVHLFYRPLDTIWYKVLDRLPL